MKKPTVSIILPTFNGEAFIHNSIKSVLKQKFKDFELIIINDGSTDLTESKITPFLKKDKRIVYLKNKTNLKLIKTLNKGLNIAQGKYIARIDDDDDWIDSNKLSKQFKKMEENPKLGLIGTNAKLIDLTSGAIKNTNLPTQDKDIRKNLLFNNQFLHTSVVIRKTALAKVGNYRNIPEAKFAEDYDLWLRITKHFQVENLQDVCVLVRIDPAGESASNFYKQKINGLKLAIQFSNNFPSGKTSILLRSLRLFIPKNVSYLLRTRL